MPSFWIQTPSDNMLSDMRAWAQIGTDKYAAIRHHLLVVEKRDGKAKDGPVHKPVEWLINTEYNMEEKITNITKYTLSIQESITSTVTTKLSQEVLAKMGLSADLNMTNLGAKLSAEVQSKMGTELTESLSNGLSTTKTYEVETKTEQTESVKVKVGAPDGSNGTRQVFIYFKLNQLFWDVYLYRTDYLQLEYKAWDLLKLRWRDIRKTILSEEILVKKPLFRIAYFEPVPAFSYRYDKYEPEVEDGNVVRSLPLTSACPGANLQPNTSMEELARSAFPVSKAEKQRAKEKLKEGAMAKGGGRPDGKYIGGKGVSKVAKKGSIKGGLKSATKAGGRRTSFGSKGRSLRKGSLNQSGSKGFAKKK